MATVDKLSKVYIDSKQLELIKILNCNTSYGEDRITDSIMSFGVVCEHDDGFMCEHRLEYLLNYLYDNGNN